MIKIAITDDHPLLREGIKNILSQEPLFDVVGFYANAKSMKAALIHTEVDVLLLDINLPDANSIELIRPLLAQYPKMYIMIISIHNEYAVINSALHEGARGYIQKNTSVEEIIKGIHEMVQGKKFLCSQTRAIFEKKQKDGLIQIPKLTRREKEILIEAATGLTTVQI